MNTTIYTPEGQTYILTEDQAAKQAVYPAVQVLPLNNRVAEQAASAARLANAHVFVFSHDGRNHFVKIDTDWRP